MRTDASLGDAVLAIALLASMGAMLFGCLGCRKREKIVEAKNSFYDHHHIGGRRVTVTRSKRVTHFNKLCQSSCSNANDTRLLGTAEDQPNYQNILYEKESAYVHPIGEEPQINETTVYQNTLETSQENIPDYENVFTDTTACQQSEYANCDFEKDDDEDDYVNG